MKKPVVFLPVLFFTILFSSAIIAVTVSGICSSLSHDAQGNGNNVKVVSEKNNNPEIIASAVSY